MMNGIFFPGTGWGHTEKLMKMLFSRLAEQGISIFPVDWVGAIPFKPIKTVDQAVDISLGFSIHALMGVDLPEHPLVISKSLGCHTAGRWAALTNVPAVHILLTPPLDSLAGFDDRQKILAIAAGGKDAVVSAERLEAWACEHAVPLFILHDLDHSLKADESVYGSLISRLMPLIAESEQTVFTRRQ